VRINPNAAGIDVDAKEHVVAVPCDQEPQPVRTFQAFTLELHELARWLKRYGIETGALESTGIYWIWPKSPASRSNQLKLSSPSWIWNITK